MIEGGMSSLEEDEFNDEGGTHYSHVDDVEDSIGGSLDEDDSAAGGASAPTHDPHHPHHPHHHHHDDDDLGAPGIPRSASASSNIDVQEALALQRPRILLMGGRRSGKTSISRVLFNKAAPGDALFMPAGPASALSGSSLSIKFVANNPYVQFEVWDFPAASNLAEGVLFEGHLLGAELVFSSCTALAFVIDAQEDDYLEALLHLRDVVFVARQMNPKISLEIFIHKVDGDLFMGEDHKLEVQREIQEHIELELEDIVGVDGPDISLSYYLTSIYDHSVLEAFSKVVHKLTPQLPAMENLLNNFIAANEVEKAFLFDVVNKMYIATDHNPVDISSYELCSDMLDIVIDVSCIYGMEGPKDDRSEASADRADKAEDEDADKAASGERLEELAFDRQSSSVIRLNNNMILYAKQVASYLALVCIVRSQNYEKRGIIDYNAESLRDALAELFEVA